MDSFHASSVSASQLKSKCYGNKDISKKSNARVTLKQATSKLIKLNLFSRWLPKKSANFLFELKRNIKLEVVLSLTQ